MLFRKSSFHYFLYNTLDLLWLLYYEYWSIYSNFFLIWILIQLAVCLLTILDLRQTHQFAMYSKLFLSVENNSLYSQQWLFAYAEAQVLQGNLWLEEAMNSPAWLLCEHLNLHKADIEVVLLALPSTRPLWSSLQHSLFYSLISCAFWLLKSSQINCSASQALTGSLRGDSMPPYCIIKTYLHGG